MGGFFFTYLVIKDFIPIELDLVSLISLMFFRFIPPKAPMPVFQLRVIKLNLLICNILFGEYFLL